MRKSNYDKMPATVVDGTLWKGWESIRKHSRPIVLSIREIYLNRQKI